MAWIKNLNPFKKKDDAAPPAASEGAGSPLPGVPQMPPELANDPKATGMMDAFLRKWKDPAFLKQLRVLAAHMQREGVDVKDMKAVQAWLETIPATAVPARSSRSATALDPVGLSRRVRLRPLVNHETLGPRDRPAGRRGLHAFGQPPVRRGPMSTPPGSRSARWRAVPSADLTWAWPDEGAGPKLQSRQRRPWQSDDLRPHPRDAPSRVREDSAAGLRVVIGRHFLGAEWKNRRPTPPFAGGVGRLDFFRPTTILNEVPSVQGATCQRLDLTRRNPTKEPRAPGLPLLRPAERRSPAAPPQAPPRTTRYEPDAGPAGSCTAAVP